MQVQVTVDFRYTNGVDLMWTVSIYKKNMLVSIQKVGSSYFTNRISVLILA